MLYCQQDVEGKRRLAMLISIVFYCSGEVCASKTQWWEMDTCNGHYIHSTLIKSCGSAERRRSNQGTYSQHPHSPNYTDEERDYEQDAEILLGLQRYYYDGIPGNAYRKNYADDVRSENGYNVDRTISSRYRRYEIQLLQQNVRYARRAAHELMEKCCNVYSPCTHSDFVAYC